MEPNQDDSHKKIPHKISFKCRKSFVYHYSLNPAKHNTVAYLTSKFNELNNEPKHVKRLSSYKAPDKSSRKPSVKLKSNEHVNTTGRVRAAVENFERLDDVRKTSQTISPVLHEQTSSLLAQRKTDAPLKQVQSEVTSKPPPVANSSFLWRTRTNPYETVKSHEMTLDNQESVYETVCYVQRNSLPFSVEKQKEPLPARPTSWTGLATATESIYETIYKTNYESIYGSNWEVGSLVSDQKSNSLYERGVIDGRVSMSDVSDKSEEWIDISDEEMQVSPFVVVRARPRNRGKGWTQRMRNQWHKTQSELGDEDHYYESLCSNNDNSKDTDDSFESDSETKYSPESNNLHLSDPSSLQGLTKFRRHMRRLRRNWSLTKSDITKSFKRIHKRKSASNVEKSDDPEKTQTIYSSHQNVPEPNSPVQTPSLPDTDMQLTPENREFDQIERRKPDGFLNKFRRSLSVSSTDFALNVGNRSTFYLTDTIDIDQKDETEGANRVLRRHQKMARPQSPPPPVPTGLKSTKTVKESRRSTSWYAEVGLFKNGNIPLEQRNSSWYAEIGLYHKSPNSSCNEDSGNAKTVPEDYYNLDSGLENSYSNQLRLQDEPLYQFYDAALFDDYMDDFDSDDYEDVDGQESLTIRPSAMELISPNKTGVTVTRTLWCEIPEVLQSSVLSTLSPHQKKLQEAKFEMITSEASYLNSLNVLWDHFVTNINHSNLLTNEEKCILFGKVRAVKRCSSSLLFDMEKCWQDNILLNGICDIVKKHVDGNFVVYVPYCENQTMLDSTLRKIRDRNSCNQFLKQLEDNNVCQSLTLYSFLLLPMQRITRWPLLIDAVLKRLLPEDGEHLTCQYTLAALNKIVKDCNEAARKKEREIELRNVTNQIEFPRNVPLINLMSSNRWLVKSGPLVHVQLKTGDDVKLTFGRRFSKLPINLFLFNDLLIVCKPKTDGIFSVLHYCIRSYVDLNTGEIIQSLPIKEAQSRNFLLLTLLENQERKMVEMLLSCNGESDKARWIEALSPPKSNDPDETLYDCWDCPQVTAVHSYYASQPDELALSRGDVVNIDRKMADGWYHGVRIRDGQIGWFPGNYTAEIANPHVRARNLKQRYRFLALSQTYLKAK